MYVCCLYLLFSFIIEFYVVNFWVALDLAQFFCQAMVFVKIYPEEKILKEKNKPETKVDFNDDVK